MSYGFRDRDAERREAVQDGDKDLKLGHLTVEVARHEALTQQFHTVHLCLDAAPAVVAAPSTARQAHAQHAAERGLQMVRPKRRDARRTSLRAIAPGVSGFQGLSEGPITGIGRIWADGKAMDMTGVTWRWYPGDEAQGPDPFISAKMGAASAPAYRGTAYVVFEELALSVYGNRLPQLSFEVFRPLSDPDTAEGLVRAVTMNPASGEFAYATQAIRNSDGGATSAENLNAVPQTPDIIVALDRLQSMAPALESVTLTAAWFGNDLRAGSCELRPGVEIATKSTTPLEWSVNGVGRADAFLVSHDDQSLPVYGGTAADFAVVQAIQEIKARGLRVTLSPVILMDVPPGNSLPNPHSDNAAEAGQPVYPSRSWITCSPATGYAGTVDNALVIDLFSGTLESVSDLTLFGGANALAVETTPSIWEILQAGTAELIAPGRYRLTRLLRGQRGTESAMGSPALAVARIVVLDAALTSLPIAEADLGVPWNGNPPRS